MTVYRSDAVRDALMDALDTVRGNAVQVQIRTLGPLGTIANGALLAKLVGGSPWAGASSGGVLTSNAIAADTDANADGTAAHYELLTTGGVWLESGICDVGGSDGVTIDNASIVTGQTVQMSGNWVNTAANDKDA